MRAQLITLMAALACSTALGQGTFAVDWRWNPGSQPGTALMQFAPVEGNVFIPDGSVGRILGLTEPTSLFGVDEITLSFSVSNNSSSTTSFWDTSLELFGGSSSFGFFVPIGNLDPGETSYFTQSFRLDQLSISEGWSMDSIALTFYTANQFGGPLEFSNFALGPTAVPEPSSMALAGLGALAILLRRRNR